jgi:hypothetical protein
LVDRLRIELSVADRARISRYPIDATRFTNNHQLFR